ncbi:MAG: hypothetical protein KC978_19445, partial [Candidatus Omnitrophica bacterium]|nr:hypothetical protein [Candidatus Omnitrophota bacterium]
MRNPPLSHPQTPIEPMRLPKRKTLWLTLLLLALIAIPLYYALDAYRSRGKEKAVGIYLVHGGQSFVWIDLDEDGELVVRDGYFYTHGKFLPRQQIYNFFIRYRDGRLLLRQLGEHETDFESNEELSLTLVDSESTPRDFDLVNADFERVDISFPFRSNPSFFSLEYYKILFDEIRQRLYAPDSEVTGHYEGQKPLPSFLHRIDDERLVEYMKKRLDASFSESDLAEFRELAAAFPKDPYIQMHAMEVESNYGDPELAEEIMEKWKETLENSPDVLFREISQRAIKAVWQAMGDPRGDDLLEIRAELESTTTDLEEKIDTLRDLCKRDHLLTTTLPVVDPVFGTSTLEEFDFGSGIDLQSLAQIIRIVATMDLIAGNREEALQKLAAIYKLGETMNSDGPVIQRMMGIGIRKIALWAIAQTLLNACESEQDLKRFWGFLERLHSENGLPVSEDLTEGDWPPFLEELNPKVNSRLVSSDQADWIREEMRIRNDEVNVVFRMLRAGTAAKLKYILTGQP